MEILKKTSPIAQTTHLVSFGPVSSSLPSLWWWWWRWCVAAVIIFIVVVVVVVPVEVVEVVVGSSERW